MVSKLDVCINFLILNKFFFFNNFFNNALFDCFSYYDMPVKDVREFIDAIDERKMNLDTRPFVSEKLREIVELKKDITIKEEKMKGTLGRLRDELSDELKMLFTDENDETKDEKAKDEKAKDVKAKDVKTKDAKTKGEKIKSEKIKGRLGQLRDELKDEIRDELKQTKDDIKKTKKDIEESKKDIEETKKVIEETKKDIKETKEDIKTILEFIKAQSKG